MSIALAFALALQGGPPLLQDRAFLAAHGAWTACTNRVVDAEAASARSAEEIAAAALAACTAEQEAVRGAATAFSGETRGREEMAILLDASRDGLAGRVRERRRRAAEGGRAAPRDLNQAYEAASRAWAQCGLDSVNAAPASMRERDIIAAALAACPAEEEAVRAVMVRMLGNETRADRLMIEARAIARDSMRRYLRERRR